MLVSAKAMLQSAEKGHYGIGAFNTNNLEWASAILEAAEKTQSPMIIQCTGGGKVADQLPRCCRYRS